MRTEDAVARTRSAGGWADLDRLSLIRVSGPQRVKFLHGLLSNDISTLAPGSSRLAALMNLKGQQIAWMRVMAESDALYCELPRSTRDTVVDTFVHYKVGSPVRFEKPETRGFLLFGQRAGDALRELGLSAPPFEADTFATTQAFGGALRVSRGLDVPAGGFTLHAEPAVAVAVEERLRSMLGETVEPATLDTLRVEEGIPWHGIDVTEDNLLHETGQLAVYHAPSKGCYLGQEVVARLEGRGGNVNKRFRGLKSTHALSKEDPVLAEHKEIGRVTTAGLSPEFGPIAMGYIHRSHAESGARVTVAGHDVEVTMLPFRA